MKLTKSSLLPITIFAIFTLDVGTLVMADTFTFDHVLVAQEDIYEDIFIVTDVGSPSTENKMTAVTYFTDDNIKQRENSLMQDGENGLETGSSITSSHSDASELVKSGANTTDYALPENPAQENTTDLTGTRLVNYADRLRVEEMALDPGALRGSTVPEPSSIILFTLGLLGLALMRRQNKCDS